MASQYQGRDLETFVGFKKHVGRKIKKPKINKNTFGICKLL
jgi:hypothetical protein